MNEYENLAKFDCPMCGEKAVQKNMENEKFVYGDKENAVELAVCVPVGTCQKCGFEYTDAEAEDIRHEAVCRHLGVLSPKEIRKVREKYNMSASDFAKLTGIGTASLSRWENGALIQSKAYDNYLYLLLSEKNYGLLKERSENSYVPKLSERKFRALKLTQEKLNKAEHFRLRTIGV